MARNKPIADEAADLGGRASDEAHKVVMLERQRGEGRPVEAEARPAAEKPASPEGKPAEEPVAKQAPGAPQAVAPAPQKAPAKKKSKAKRVLPIILIAAVAGGAWFGYDYWTNGRFLVSTDDAYVQADVSTLGTKVSGYVQSVAVNDGDHVKAGDVLVKLDPTDYAIALASARARRATQTATIDRIAQQVVAQQAQIASAEAGLASAEAAAKRAAAAFDRAQTLSAQNFSSKATLDQAIADRDQTVAAVESARAAIAAAKANLAVIDAQKTEAEQSAKELDLAIDKAQSDLDATVIRAPADGVIGNRAAQPGQYVAPGSRLMALVPLQSVYVAANYKETQLGDLRPGQKVELEVDSVSGRTFEGTVESLSPASGSVFSLLPPENATGNFTKITQRVPVRITVPADVAAQGLLRPGLSVVATVDIRTGPKS